MINIHENLEEEDINYLVDTFCGWKVTVYKTKSGSFKIILRKDESQHIIETNKNLQTLEGLVKFLMDFAHSEGVRQGYEEVRNKFFDLFFNLTINTTKGTIFEKEEYKDILNKYGTKTNNHS